MNPYRCDICNKFMNPENGFYVWTPYGNSTMLEPPEREYAHIECYENLKEKGVLIIRSDTRDKNFSTFINSLLSKGRFYFKEKEIFEWFKNTEFKFRIININNTNIILASKENIFR